MSTENISLVSVSSFSINSGADYINIFGTSQEYLPKRDQHAFKSIKTLIGKAPRIHITVTNRDRRQLIKSSGLLSMLHCHEILSILATRITQLISLTVEHWILHSKSVIRRNYFCSVSLESVIKDGTIRNNGCQLGKNGHIFWQSPKVWYHFFCKFPFCIRVLILSFKLLCNFIEAEHFFLVAFNFIEIIPLFSDDPYRNMYSRAIFPLLMCTCS